MRARHLFRQLAEALCEAVIVLPTALLTYAAFVTRGFGAAFAIPTLWLSAIFVRALLRPEGSTK